jgi:SWI/SNF-related matrix-associated actin-dependent regulator 1 of chromatin subfamily A
MAAAPVNFDRYLAEGVSLYPFQTVSVAYALVARRCFIADEMGLGKSISSLTALEVEGAFPAVVVCPASLKGNWEREVGKFIPHRKVQVISGRASAATAPEITGDIVVINSDILESWEPRLSAHGFKALVLDESHYYKSAKAQRTRAAMRLAAAIPADGLVLCLTGTPILNRPAELVTQLRILGQLENVATRPRKSPEKASSWEFSFLFDFCGPSQNGYGWDFKGSSNLAELNYRLRSTCFVRHARTDVTDLKATNRVPVSLSLNGALKEYRAAERDLISWVKGKKGEAAAKSAARAEGLSRINALRQLSAAAKVPATIEWVDNFFASYPESSLVIFAHHRSMQQALVEHFNCPAILGGQSLEETEAAKEAFQSGRAKIIVCSLSAAREGHTLTAAHDVLFTELPWTPGAFDQAADRCNRIGQTHDVTSWTLLAEDTIDWRLWNIIGAKREVFEATVTGGGHDVAQDEATAMILLGQYADA